MEEQPMNMEEQPIYWLETLKGRQVTPASASRAFIEKLQEEYKAMRIETTIQTERP